MQLLYVWIEEYKNIKKQGFNFSSEFLFEYDDKNGELTIKNNPNYIKNFFEDNISNVTAIVGKNGSGKSSITNFPKLKRNNNVKGFVLFIEGDDNIEKQQIYYDDFNNNNLQERYNIICNKKIIYKQYFNQDNYIYYSNTFNSEKVLKNLIEKFIPSFEDISLDYLLVNNGFHIGEENNLISIFKSFNIIIYMNFLKNYQNKIPFNLPQEIKIEPLIFIRLQEFKTIKTQENSKIHDNIITKYYKDIEINKTPVDLLLKQIYWSVFFYFSYIMEKTSHVVLFNIENISLKNNSIEILLIELLKKSIKDYSSTLNYLKYYYNSILIFFEDLKLFLYKNQENCVIYKEINVPHAYIMVLVNNNDTQKIIDNYINTINYKQNEKNKENNVLVFPFSSGFLSFDWQNLSFGQKAYLELFSRFNYAKNKLEKANILQKKDSLTLFIDEGEIGFHPEWQREYLHNLITILPKIFEGKKLQIILTSHSPFVISDLPKENVIFLDTYKEESKDKKEGEEGYIKGDIEVKNGLQKAGNCKVVKGIEKEQTFGANIHTLLSDGFFMEGGLMGEFANNKIKEVINWIKDKREDKKEEIQKIIKMIGEDVLRMSLSEYFMKQFRHKINQISLEDREQELLNELEEIRKRKNQS